MYAAGAYARLWHAIESKQPAEISRLLRWRLVLSATSSRAPVLRTFLLDRLPKKVRRYYASFNYQAKNWSTNRRTVAKVEWHPREPHLRAGFTVINLPQSAERVVALCNQRGTADQHIKEGENAVKWTRLPSRSFLNNAVRL